MKGIIYNEKTKVFTLRTRNSMYQMQVRQHDTLVHLYYGADVGDMEIDYRIISLDRGFSGNPYEAGNDRTFSLDVLPQEYSGYGNGDYRINSLEVEHEDGSDAVHLRYKSHEICKGKYSLKGLPAMFGTEEEAETLKITLYDRVSGLQVHLLYGVFPELDVITRAVRMENQGEKQVTIQRAMSMEMDYPNMHMDMVHFYGRHAMERIKERLPLHHGVQSVESKRGTSSHQHNPFVILTDKTTTEKSGDCYGYALVYSGNFRCEIEVDQMNQTRFVMGIHPYHFSYRLNKGDIFETPEVIMAYSDRGFGRLSHIFHDAYRSNLIRSKYVTMPRPVLINNWEATYFEFNDEKLLNIAKEAKEIGLDMFVLDDGWFGKRDSDISGLGDWTVNENKIKEGLPALVKKIKDMGLKFGLWIEPEMVSEDSELYRRHPEWCLRIPQRNMNRSRFQLNLDITRKEVRDYIMEQIFAVMDSCDVDYIKWDMNRSVDNVYSLALPNERQGEVFHRYMLGVYEMMERLITRYPDLLFENCSGGGGRFDAGMLYYSPQIWCSDNTDAIDRLKIQYGTSFGYPISTMGAHVSVCPNHQTGRSVPFETRAVVASAGTFGYELDLEKLTPQEKELAKKQIKEYKKMEHLVQTGDYYRLTSPYSNHDYVVWQFVSKDKRETLVNGVMLRNEANPHIHILRLEGLIPDMHYQDMESGNIYTGAALMKAGVPLPPGSGDYQPVKFRFCAKNDEQ
ncbi:MAG: alpha-galactosidase [Eubacteriales bacterium]|nr:alpha-galactosidase [Eubacteriales bacterium]